MGLVVSSQRLMLVNMPCGGGVLNHLLARVSAMWRPIPGRLAVGCIFFLTHGACSDRLLPRHPLQHASSRHKRTHSLHTIPDTSTGCMTSSSDRNRRDRGQHGMPLRTPGRRLHQSSAETTRGAPSPPIPPRPPRYHRDTHCAARPCWRKHPSSHRTITRTTPKH